MVVETCQQNRDRDKLFHLAGDTDIINHIEILFSVIISRADNIFFYFYINTAELNHLKVETYICINTYIKK